MRKQSALEAAEEPKGEERTTKVLEFTAGFEVIDVDNKMFEDTDTYVAQAVTTSLGIMRMLTCCEEILLEKKRPLSCRTPVFHFFRSSSRDLCITACMNLYLSLVTITILIPTLHSWVNMSRRRLSHLMSPVLETCITKLWRMTVYINWLLVHDIDVSCPRPSWLEWHFLKIFVNGNRHNSSGWNLY
jgi:hypothetical protein